MSNKINDKWELRICFNAIRRHLTEEVNQYSVNRLRIELKYAMNKLNILEKGLKNV